MLQFVNRVLKINSDPFEKSKPFIQYLRVIRTKKKQRGLFIYIIYWLQYAHITTKQMAHILCVRVAYGYPFSSKNCCVSRLSKIKQKNRWWGVLWRVVLNDTIVVANFFFACFFFSLSLIYYVKSHYIHWVGFQVHIDYVDKLSTTRKINSLKKITIYKLNRM